MKAYIIYGGSRNWLTATLVMENGWAPFSHLCSHPCFMAGDLWEDRPERQAILKQMGIEVELVLPPIAGHENLPDGLLAKHDDKKNWEHLNDEYKRLKETAT